jgi:hypothetical protein
VDAADALRFFIDGRHCRSLMNPSQQTQEAPSGTARPDLPIAEAAWDVLEVERAAPVQGDFNVFLGDSFTDPVLRSQFARQEHTQQMRSYRLREVTLDASLMLLLMGRSRIPETRYLVTDEEYAATLVKPLKLMRQDPSQYYVVGSNRPRRNYYHWLVQSVPAIDCALRQRGAHGVTLLLPDLLPWQAETLALLGYQDVPRLTLDLSKTYLLPEAEYSDFLGVRTSSIVSYAAAATFRRLAAAAPWLPDTADEIYVARTDAQNRAVANEAELIDFLDRQGVRIIVPGSLSVAEQIAAFRTARLVIGPHGAGMSNIAFCQPRSFVYELLPQNYPNMCFNRIAQSVGLNYCADLFETGGESDVHRQTWRIDIKLVAAQLDSIRARIAATPRVESAMNFLKRTQSAPPGETPRPVLQPSATMAPAAEISAPAEQEPPRSSGLLVRSLRVLRRAFSRGSGR